MKKCMRCGANYDGRDGDYMDCPYCGEWSGNSRVYDDSGSTHAYEFGSSDNDSGNDGKTECDKVFDWLAN